MKIVSICPNSFAANTYLLISEEDAFIVDPAVSLKAIQKVLSEENAELRGILLTHGHFDHTVSVDVIRESYSVPLMIHKEDAPMLTNGFINGFYDFYGKECVHKEAQVLLNDGDELSLGSEKIQIISTSGHSPGSICFLCTDDSSNNFLITGDTLFASSIGRCDLWRGDESEMKASILKLSSFDKSAVIYPGHGAAAPLSTALAAARYYIDF